LIEEKCVRKKHLATILLFTFMNHSATIFAEDIDTILQNQPQTVTGEDGNNIIKDDEIVGHSIEAKTRKILRSW
jgi:hypothetical protein